MTQTAASRPLHPSYDVVIVGARCAGAATALLLARQGLRVLLAERGQHGADTLSTHALMRAGVIQLHRWNVLPRLQDARTPPVRRTTFHYGDEVVAIPIKPGDGIDALYAPRRTVLDRLLAEAAAEAGAELVYGLRAVDLLRSSDARVTGVIVEDRARRAHHITADVVVGADGVQSTVARLVDARPYRVGRHATAAVYGYWSGLDADGYHWYFRQGVSAGLVPTNDDQVCLFASVPSQRFHDEIRLDLAAGHRRILAEVDGRLAQAAGDGRPVGILRGFAGHPGHCRQSWGPGWALVGDAGYFKDPVTAHGITDALRDAEILARAVASGSDQALADYQTARDDLSHDLFEVTDDIASYAWDEPTIKQWHLRLSEAMNPEVAWVRRYSDPPR
jgi:flavin-dependent dehydrogenase